MATILCVDDEPAIGVVLEHALTKMGHRPLLASNVQEALKALAQNEVDVVISDYRMPGATGLDLLSTMKEQGHRIPLIMMTAHSSIEHAVLSIKSGADDYLTKPVRPETLELAVTQVLEVTKLRQENEAFRHEIAALRSEREIVGDSKPMRDVMRTISMIAPTRATVLLQGESGTGKELFARAIHEQSPRHDYPFVTLNCAAMPEGLVESALFGHERGAFTGATQRAAGAFERADRGTLMLDEISEMRLDLQAKLLRVIQEQEFERVGGRQTLKVDVRLIATTNRDLKSTVEKGEFREDLYYRLNVVPVRMPPLRERLDDVPLLVLHFARLAAKELGVSVAGIQPETLDLLQSYHWPGNVRELANAVERAAIFARNAPLRPEAFRPYLDEPSTVGALAFAPSSPSSTPQPTSAEELTLNLREREKLTIERALQTTGGNRTRAAKLLGISERTLRNKLNVPKS